MSNGDRGHWETPRVGAIWALPISLAKVDKVKTRVKTENNPTLKLDQAMGIYGVYTSDNQTTTTTIKNPKSPKIS